MEKYVTPGELMDWAIEDIRNSEGIPLEEADLISDENSGNMPLTKYGQLRLKYLQEQQPELEVQLASSGELISHIEQIQSEAEELEENLIQQLAHQQGVTEQLKASDQMEWVQMMNNITNQAQEIVLNELIYN